MQIVFMGTPDFAVGALEALIAHALGSLSVSSNTIPASVVLETTCCVPQRR